MEIEEFLERINLEKAQAIFQKKEMDVTMKLPDGTEKVEKKPLIKVVSIMDEATKGSCGISAAMEYNGVFPSNEPFMISPTILKNILKHAEEMIIDGKSLRVKSKGTGTIEFDLDIVTMSNMKRLNEEEFNFSNPFTMTDQMIADILYIDSILDIQSVDIDGNKEKNSLIMRFLSKVGKSASIYEIPEYRDLSLSFGSTLIDILKLVSKVKEVQVYVSGKDSKRKGLKLTIRDDNSQISYIIFAQMKKRDDSNE